MELIHYPDAGVYVQNVFIPDNLHPDLRDFLIKEFNQPASQQTRLYVTARIPYERLYRTYTWVGYLSYQWPHQIGLRTQRFSRAFGSIPWELVTEISTTQKRNQQIIWHHPDPKQVEIPPTIQ